MDSCTTPSLAIASLPWSGPIKAFDRPGGQPPGTLKTALRTAAEKSNAEQTDETYLLASSSPPRKHSGPELGEFFLHPCGEIIIFLLKALAEGEPLKTADNEVLPQLRNLLLKDFLDCLVFILEPLLFQERHLIEFLSQPTVYNLLYHVVRLTDEVILLHLQLLFLLD